MTTYNWSGGKGSYESARHWGPQGVPGKGDTASIAQGEVAVRHEDVQATVSIGGADAGSPPVLDVRNSSIGTVTTTGNPYLPSSAGPEAPQPAPEYATVNVVGDSAVHNLDVGAGSFDGRAETTVNLLGHGTLTAAFSVGNGSTLTVNGGKDSSLNLESSQVSPFNGASFPVMSEIRGGQVVIDAPVLGQATIDVNGPFVAGLTIPLPSGFESGSPSLEFGSSVASGTTVVLQEGDLLIDRPHAFLGQIDLVPDVSKALNPPASFLYLPPGPQSVTLKGIAATSFSFDDAKHTLTLFSGTEAVDHLRFTQDVTAVSFTPAGSTGPGSSIAVSQIAGGVFISHLPASTPAGATLLPMQS